MIWQELVLMIGALLFGCWLFMRLWGASRTEPKFWLVEPGLWANGSGRKYIIRAVTEEEADQVFLRRVCGWTVIRPGERINAKITLLNANDDVIIIE